MSDDRPITTARVAQLAHEAFAADYAAAERGTKGMVLERLRHAAVDAATGGEHRRLSTCDGAALAQTWHLLRSIVDGEATYEPRVGEVVFALPDGWITGRWPVTDAAAAGPVGEGT